jgi:hypothetical protein
MTVRAHKVRGIVLVGIAVVGAACSSTTSGHPVNSGSPAASSVTPSASSPDFPSASASVSASTGSSPAASTGPTSSGTCVSGAKYCDQFAAKGSGWTTENQTNYFSQYDPYLGGTYRLGTRTDATATEDAPVNITSIASDYSVQVDVDTILGPTTTAANSAGIVCWEHPSKDGQSTAAFLLRISGTEANIGFWGDANGTYHQIAHADATGLLKAAPAATHLTAQCIQGSTGSASEAELSLAVDGTVVVSGKYASSTNNFSWSVGPKVGVLVSGKGGDMFYDNFGITSKCAGSFC